MRRDGRWSLALLGIGAAITLFAGLGLERAAFAEDGANCRCEQYKDLKKFTSLADEVATIGPRAIHPADGSPIENELAETAAVRLRITSDKLIPEECKKKLLHSLGGFHATFFARVIGGKDPMQPAPEGGAAINLYYGYNSLYSSYQSSTAASQCAGNYTAACFQSAKNNAWSTFGNTLAGASGTAAGYGGYRGDDLKLMAAYHNVLSAGGEAAMLNYVKSGKDGLNDKQFLSLVQMVGQRLGDDYDYNRIKPGDPASKGIVTGDQLLTAAASNTMNYPYGGASAGVCRDIATLQAKMLQTRGFPNSYVLSYGTLDGGHAIAVAGDKGSGSTFYGFSYSIMSTNRGLDGGEALFRRDSPASIGEPDAALNYYVSKPEGAIVANVPSSMGKFLEEAAGFNIRQIDPLARETSSILGGGVTLSSDSGKTVGSVRAVVGQDGVGSQYVGGALGLAYGQGTMAPGQVGVFMGVQKRPGDVFGTGPTGDANAGLLYVQAEQHVITPNFKLSERGNTTLKVDTSLTALGMVGKMLPLSGPSGFDPKTGVMIGGDVRLRSEAQVNQQFGNLHSQYRAGMIVSPGANDIRSADASNFVALTLNSAYVGTTQTLRVKDMTLFADATAAVDLLGARGIAEVGAAGSKWAASAYIAGRITNGTALYEDNTLRRVGVSAMVRPVKQLQLGVVGEMPIEGDTPLANAHLMGTAIVSF